MPNVIRTARAEEDLIEAWLYVAEDNPAAADRILDGIERAFEQLGAYPKLGPARPDLASGFRYFAAGIFLILYREIPEGVEIVRVVHGARHLPDLL